MKKSFLWASLAMLAIVAINVVSCNENEELDDFYSLDLDVTSRTLLQEVQWPTMNQELHKH